MKVAVHPVVVGGQKMGDGNGIASGVEGIWGYFKRVLIGRRAQKFGNRQNLDAGSVAIKVFPNQAQGNEFINHQASGAIAALVFFSIEQVGGFSIGTNDRFWREFQAREGRLGGWILGLGVFDQNVNPEPHKILGPNSGEAHALEQLSDDGALLCV